MSQTVPWRGGTHGAHETYAQGPECVWSSKQVDNNNSNRGANITVHENMNSLDLFLFLAKRRTANHPCPICGKHYVNEGSLRKHLTCHPETAQLSTSLRMWPCSVCQAVFTLESGRKDRITAHSTTIC